MSDLKEQIEKVLENSCLRVYGVNHVNFKPHPYVIGHSHITYASENFGGGLGKVAIESGERDKAVRCYHKDNGKRCNLPYAKHESDHVAFLQTVKDCTADEVQILLQKIVDEIGETAVDGFSFIESEFEIT